MPRKVKQVHSDFVVTNFGTNDVTGSCVMVEIPDENLKLLLDFGLFQSSTKNIKDIYDINYKKIKVPLDEIDAILVSHAHYDHCSALGMCCIEERNFTGKIMCTEPSQPLISLNVRDSAFVMAQQTKVYNRANPKKPILPLYTEEHANNLINLLQGYRYNEEIPLSENVFVEFLPAGHLLGDSSILITYMKDEFTTRRLLYTGDINPYAKQQRPYTMKWNDERVLDVDVVIMESTYAGRVHEQINIEEKLEKILVEQCLRNNKVLFIPVFAIGRSTQVLHYLKKIFDGNTNLTKANIPIYLAGKMLNTSHNHYSNDYYKKHFVDEEWHESYNMFKWGRVHKLDKFTDVEEKLLDNKPKIILASSGMCTGGYSTFLAQQLIGRENVSFLTFGYMGEGTHGRAILDTRDKDKKIVQIQGTKYNVRCKVEEPISLSGHGDHEQLLKLISKGCNQKKLKKIIIIHGSQDGKKLMKESIENTICMDKKEVLIPQPNEVLRLFNGN